MRASRLLYPPLLTFIFFSTGCAAGCQDLSSPSDPGLGDPASSGCHLHSRRLRLPKLTSPPALPSLPHVTLICSSLTRATAAALPHSSTAKRAVPSPPSHGSIATRASGRPVLLCNPCFSGQPGLKISPAGCAWAAGKARGLFGHDSGSCRCLTTDSLPWGYPKQLFGLQRVLELDG